MARGTFIGYSRFFNSGGNVVASVPVVEINVEYPNDQFNLSLDNIDLSSLDYSTANDEYLLTILPDNPNRLFESELYFKTPGDKFLYIVKSNVGTTDPVYLVNGGRAESSYSFNELVDETAFYYGPLRTVVIFNSFYGHYFLCQFRISNSDQIAAGLKPSKILSKPIVSNIGAIVPTPDIGIPVNFYHCSEVGVPYEGDINLARGESSSPLKFTIVRADGRESLYTGEIDYSGSLLGKAYTIENNIITVAENTNSTGDLITAKPAGFDNLFSFINLVITNPMGPYDPAGPSGPGGTPGTGNPGGGPSGPGTGTLVPNGSNNPNVASGGTFTMYAANMGTLQGLGAWLYSSNFFDAVGRDIMNSLWNSPIEGIISITAFPFGVPASTNVPEKIKFGNLEVPIALPVLQNSSYQINWGSVSIEPTWNSFLDYAPHTKIELYLPFSTGFVTLDPNDVMDGSVSIATNVDLIKGTCVHVVSGKYGVIGTYGGVCGLQIPVSGVDTAGKALNLLVSGVSTAVTAGSGTIAGSAKLTAGISETNSANRILSGIDTSMGISSTEAKDIAGRVSAQAVKPIMDASKKYSAIASRAAGIAGQTAIAAFRTPASIQRSGSFATNGGGLGPTTPFIIFSCPDVNIPSNYGHFYGYPLNATMKIGDLKGYSEITGVHLNNVPALVPELDEISSLLEGGVIL